MLHGFLSHHLASGASHSPLRQMGLGASQLPADILSKRLMFLFFFLKGNHSYEMLRTPLVQEPTTQTPFAVYPFV
jgi:hypothetical protein